MRLFAAVLLSPVQVIFALQQPPGPRPLRTSGNNLRQALCERYAEAILHDGPNSEDPHQQCQQYIRDISAQGTNNAGLNSLGMQGLCESLGAGLVALHLSGSIKAGNWRQNAEACSSLVSPQPLTLHAVEAPEPNKIQEFGDAVTNDTSSRPRSPSTTTTMSKSGALARVTPMPGKIEEFGKGSQTTTTTTSITTTVARTAIPLKQFRNKAALRDAYEPLPRVKVKKFPEDQVSPGQDAASDRNISGGNASSPGGNKTGPTDEASVFNASTQTTGKNRSLPANITAKDACAACASRAEKGAAHRKDIMHGPEEAVRERTDVTATGGRTGSLPKGQVQGDACLRTVRQLLKLLGARILRKEDVGGNVGPICERQARGELTRGKPGKALTRSDELAIEELCFKMDGRLTMAIEQGILLPRSTPEGMKVDKTPEQFCGGFVASTAPKQFLKKIPDIPDDLEPTVPPTPPPDPTELAIHWATELNGFHGICVNFLAEFQANITNTVQLSLRRYETPEGGRGRGIKISHAFPWSGDLQGFKTCQDGLFDVFNQSRSNVAPAVFADADWPERMCLDIALGYTSVKSSQLESPRGLESEAQAFSSLGGTTPNIFCRTYATQFGPQVPPEANGTVNETGESAQGGLSGQMSGNEDPPRTPRLTKSSSANHAEQKQRGTEKKTHWLTGSMPGPNHDVKSLFF